MRELHAGLLMMQGIPIILLSVLFLWIAYHVRVAVNELRAIRRTMESLIVRFEDEEADPPRQGNVP